MKKLLLICLLLSICSCIQFKFQRMSWSYSKETDELKIFQEYEGIYTLNGQVTSKELEQYTTLMRSKDTYFFNNWIFEYSGSKVDDDLDKNDRPDLRPLLLLLKKSVVIKNGNFYTNTKGDLCGSQKVTVKNTSKILDLSNKLIRTFYEEKAAKDGDFYLAKPPNMKYVDIVDNQLIYRHIISYVDYQKGKAEVINELLKSDSPHKDKIEALLKVLWQDVQINYNAPFLEVIAGKPKQKVNVIESRTFMEGDYNNTFKKKVDEDHIIHEQLNTAAKESFFR